MPEALWDAVKASRFVDDMLQSWADIGPENRTKLSRYVNRGWTGRSRRQRGQMAALQLLRPEFQTRIPITGSGTIV